MAFKTPILINAFNRPDTTQRVFRVVRKIKPEKLFIAIDGPRVNRIGELNKVNNVKRVFDDIDWSCEVKTLYREKNMGCHKAIPNAIDWFFSFVEEGIILEDDCLPNSSFFDFCEELLGRYRNNNKIMMISGDNFVSKSCSLRESYYFSAYAFIWGWATWKRSWIKFDNQMKSYPNLKKTGKIKKNYPNILERLFWMTAFTNKYNNYSEGWDMKWYYTLVKNEGLSIVPSVNLITNIGFRSDATVTKKPNKKIVVPSNNMKFPLIHPVKIEENPRLDRESFRKVYLSTVNLRNIFNNYLIILRRFFRI